MKTQSRNQKKNTALITAGIIAALLIASALVYVLVFKGNLFGWQLEQSDINTNPPTQEQIDNANDIKKESIEGESESTDSSSKTDDPATQTPSNLALTLTVANTNHVRILINGVYSNGTCTLTLSRTGSSSVTMTASVIQSGPDSSTCQGFDYETLSGSGWLATVNVNANRSTASVSKEVE